MKREVKVGIFAVVMIGSLWAGIRFLKGFDIFSRNAVYYAAYDRVDGVQSASPVEICGVKVGTVTDIAFDAAKDGRVILRLTVKRKYRIPADTEARIFSNSIMGAKAIDLVLGGSSEYLQPGDTLCSGRTPDLMDMAGSELEFVKQKVARVVDDLTRTTDNLNRIMERNAASIEGTMTHLNSITGTLDDVLRTQRVNLTEAVEGFSRFAGMLGENSPRMDSILMNLHALSEELAESDLAGTLGQTVENLNALLAGIEAGDGTVGQLMKDPRLYETLNRTAADLSSLLEDLQARPARYVHFSVFGKDPEKADRKQQAKEARRAVRAERDSLRSLR